MIRYVRYAGGDFMNKKTRSLILLTLTAIIWGFAFIAQRVGGNSTGSLTYNAIRFALGSLSLIPVMLIFEKRANNKDKRRHTMRTGMLCGILLFTASTLQQYGVMLTDYAGKAGFITDFYIILVPLFGIFLHKKTSRSAWVGAFLALVGFYFLCMQDSFSINFGDALIFACALFFALHILAVEHFAPSIYAIRFSFYQYITCTLLSAVGMLMFERIPLENIIDATIPILYGGILSVGVGYTLQTLGQIGVDSKTAAIILSCESVFCALGSALLLNEVMTMQSYFGCALVFIGILVAQIPSKKSSS